MITNCKTCGGITYNGKNYLGHPHICPPKWLVWYPEEGREFAYTVFAHDAEDAAMKWAVQTESDREYWLEEMVCVALASESEHKVVRVLGEHEITWRAEVIMQEGGD